MDVSKKEAATDAQNAPGQPSASRQSSSSSSGNDSPDSPLCTSRSGKVPVSSKSPKSAITKNTVNSKVAEATSEMLNIPQEREDRKSSTTNVTKSGEVPRVEVSGRIASASMILWVDIILVIVK